MSDPLPIEAVLPDLLAALAREGRAVLQAPPGAGKTTRVPLALLPVTQGRILMLEPRRLAARAAAERMAQTLGETVGQTVGYRMRGAAKVGPDTRIEVVTEALLTRMIQRDPTLEGIGTVIFDEFHERSLHADLGLALAWETRSALRDDLNIIVMSATLDAGPVAALLDDAPVITAEGRSFPVETRWLDRPLPPRTRLPEAVADLILHAVSESEGSALVFLPGEGEIRRTEALLAGRLPADCTLHPLFGAMEITAQRAAIAPVKKGRKLVLATAIAETSLTIEGVRIVIDAGRARRARFDPGAGMSRLVTERVTRAEAEQRRGRAGRLAPGTCYRLWTRGEDGALAAFAPPEIEVADLAPLALDLAAWGTPDGTGLALLTPPNPGALAEAQALLRDLGALDDQGRITAHGRALNALPLHPRLAHMLALAGPAAAPLAALMGDRDPLPRAAPADLALRLEALSDPRRFASQRPWQADRATLARVSDEAKRLARGLTAQHDTLVPAAMAALAYPDRIALRRPGDAPRYLMSGGKGAILNADDPLATQRLLVATDLDGDAREARIRLALPISEAELRALFPDRLHWQDVCHWSRRDRRVLTRQQERLGALVLDDRTWPDAPPEAVARAALDGLSDIGLPFSDAARRLQARNEQARAEGADLPDMSDETLIGTLETWLLPHLSPPPRTEAHLRALNLLPALTAMLTWDQSQTLDRLMPAQFTSPLGRRIPIDYSGDHPEITARLQEMFGVTSHPTVGPARRPLRIILTSPAQRPIQVTLDLPGFWASSYADVRKDMRGRYPRHDWPEDPSQAKPTLRAKPRGT